MAEGELLGSGRDADVYAAGPGLVLRRNRDGRSAQHEGEILRRLTDLGYPVPRWEGGEGPDLLMERVDGPTLGEAMFAGTVPMDDGARVLAALHRDLHALPWPGVAPGQALLHRDLHPLNVIVSARGPVVIDWSNARPGPPGLEVAVTVLVLAQVGLGDQELTEPMTGFLEVFVDAVEAPYAEHVDEAAEFRRANPHQTAAEAAMFDEAVALTRRLASP